MTTIQAGAEPRTALHGGRGVRRSELTITTVISKELRRVTLQHTNVRRSSLRRSDGEEAGLHATYTTTGLVLDRLIPPNGSSSPTSTSPYHGPRRALPQQHPINQAMTSDYAESGAS